MKHNKFSLKGWLMIAASLALTVLSFATPALAQQPTGAIEGTITDQSGAVLASAKISITEKATGRVIEVATNSGGYFVARALLPGTYDVKVEHAGFSAGRVENVVVQTGQVSSVSVGLKIGATTEVVQVEGTSAQLQVDTSRQTIDGVVTAQQIAQLPLNQRNFLDLATLQPSVIVRDGEMIDPTKTNAYRAATVNGSSGTGTRVQIDGIDVTDETVGTTSANISTDAVQEFQLSRANFDLSTSLTTSGAINIVSRGGSNEFHGAGFYFWRSDRLAARQDFLDEKPPFRRQQVGYSLGGPIVKDKLFFFSNWERTYQSTQNVVTSGDFPTVVDGTVSLPVGIRYTTHRLDWNATGRLRIFYRHSYDDNLATGGGGASPFQNVDWTNVHAIGADLSGSRTTHSFRFGYVNFNNRIESQELDPFNFNRTPQGIPFQLNVGDLSLGPNGLAPQQTYQDNFQSKYDGSLVKGNHTFRFGADINRVILGGFANFAGPLTVNGLFNSTVKAGLPAAQQGNPLAYPLDSFSTGPNTGFFTNESAHNLPHGGHRNTRYAGYVGDSWRIKRNFTFNLGTRWEYDTGFFTGKAPRLPILDVYGPKTGDVAKFPKDAFSPQVGFAWDIFGNGKTSIRGGFYRSYEMNIFNNTLFDEFARLPTGIGPTALSFDGVVGPDGRPINIGAVPGCAAADVAAGDYTCLTDGRPISSVLGTLGQIHQAVQAAYSSFKFDPTKGITEFENNRGVTFGGQFPGTYKIPYSMQFTIGVQRELWPNQVLTVDYVRNRGVGLPFLMGEFERRLAARTLNAAAASGRVTSFLTNSCQGQSISAALSNGCLRANGTRFIPTIANFSLANDTVFTGLTPNIDRARLLTGGFSTYQGLQARLEGRFGKVSDSPYNPVRGLSYTISYALGRAEATGGSNRTEFINNTINNDNWNSAFGPSGNDRTHIFGLGALMEVPFGFRLNQIWTFRTATPQNLTIPFLDSFAGSNGIFTTDINGDGGSGTSPRGDLLPGTQVGDMGRKIKSFNQLNQLISAFNSNFAGKLTPAGQALVNAGVFTEAQLRALGGVIKPIPLAPVSNPWPFENHLNLDLRITRPIAITERFKVEPSADIFNLFNNNSLGLYGPGLDGSTGSLNFDYTDQVDRAELNRTIRHRQKNTRLIQLGVRVTF